MGHNIKTKCFFFWLQEWESCPAAASFPLAVRGPRRGQVQWPVLQAVCHSSQRWDSFLHPGEWAWPLLARHSKAPKGSLFHSSRGSRAPLFKVGESFLFEFKTLVSMPKAKLCLQTAHSSEFVLLVWDLECGSNKLTCLMEGLSARSDFVSGHRKPVLRWDPHCVCVCVCF